MTDSASRPSGSRATIGPYEIVSVLDRGRSATIYAGFAPDTGREVAVKVLADAEGPSFDAQSPARQLVHRHIVRVFDQGVDGDLSYVVMERLRGRTLRQRLTDPRFGDAIEMRTDLVAQLCVALHAAHRHGLVHGRITPDNVFVTDDGVVKVLNFVRLSTSGATLVSGATSPADAEYSSPEQLLGSETIDGRADVFSAGVILYELVTGRHPFHSSSVMATHDRIVRETQAPLDGMPALNDIVAHALEKDPERRTRSAQELAHAIWRLSLVPDTPPVEEAAPAETVYVERDPVPQAAPPAPVDWMTSLTGSRTNTMAAGAAIGALLLLGGALFYMC